MFTEKRGKMHQKDVDKAAYLVHKSMKIPNLSYLKQRLDRRRGIKRTDLLAKSETQKSGGARETEWKNGMPGNCKRSEDKIEKLCSGSATIFILILIWMAGSEILGKGVGYEYEYEYDIYAKVIAGKQTGVSLNDPAPKKMGGDDLQCLCNSQQCKRKELLRRQRQGYL
nr:hypothetical protein Iba_chr13dCG5410 [Ipomoea batatas]